MRTIVQKLREETNLTQNELAEKSGLSLRTIQRIEAGNIPKGFTLKAIANTFGIEPIKLTSREEFTNLDRTKLINLSVLMGLLFPFGGVIFPLILTKNTIDKKNKQLGKSIVSVQILIAVMLSILMIISPFVQKGLSFQFPLFIIPLIIFIILKILVVVINGISLNKKNDLHKILKINYI